MKGKSIIGISLVIVGILAFIGTLLFTGESEVNRGDNIPFVNNWMHVIGFVLIAAGVAFLFAFRRR